MLKITVQILRWIARGVSVLFIAFVLLSMLGGGQDPRSRPLVPFDYVMLTVLGLEVVGLAIAWKWELVGGLIVIVAYVIGVILNPLTFRFPMILIPVVGGVFVFCSLMSKRGKAQKAEVESASPAAGG